MTYLAFVLAALKMLSASIICASTAENFVEGHRNAPGLLRVMFPSLMSMGMPSIFVTLDDAVACVRARLRARRGFNFATLNLDHLVKLRVDSAFRAAYERMNFVSADGAPVAALARQQTPSVRRATGADLLVPLCRMAARDKIPVALFGSTPESLEAAARTGCARWRRVSTSPLRRQPRLRL